MISLTPTKLRDYLACPHLYQLRHVQRRGAAVSSPALAFGRSMHRALDLLHRPATMPNCGGGDGTPDVKRLLRRCWEDAYPDRQSSEAYFSSACAALRRYLSVDTDAGETLGTEAFMARIFNSGDMRFRLGCKADRLILTPDGVLEVLDYKTCASGRVPTPEWLACDSPTFIYYVLARSCYPRYDRVRVTLLNVLSLARVSVEYTAEEVAANKRLIVGCLERIAAGEFDARRCEACAWCTMQELCPVFGAESSFDDVR